MYMLTDIGRHRKTTGAVYHNQLDNYHQSPVLPRKACYPLGITTLEPKIQPSDGAQLESALLKI